MTSMSARLSMDPDLSEQKRSRGFSGYGSHLITMVPIEIDELAVGSQKKTLHRR
jgi:hypothetical protein